MSANATDPLEPLPTTPVLPTSIPPAAAAAKVTVGTLIARTFEVWKRNLGLFAVVSFAAHVLNLVFMGALGSPFLAQRARLGTVTPEAQAFITSWRYWAMVGGLLFGAYFLAAVLSAGALDHLAGRRPTVGGMLARVVRRSPTLFVSNLLALLAAWIGFLFLVVPGVILTLMYALIIPIALAEPLSPLKVNGRSRALTKGHRAKLLALFVILYLGAYAPTFVVGIVGGDVPWLATVLNVLVSGVLGPLFLVSPAVAYHELRVAAEGAGTAELERVFG